MVTAGYGFEKKLGRSSSLVLISYYSEGIEV